MRVSTGRFATSVACMTAPTLDCVTSMSGAAPDTVSVSLSPATPSVKSSVSAAPTIKVPLRVPGANPDSSVLTS